MQPGFWYRHVQLGNGDYRLLSFRLVQLHVIPDSTARHLRRHQRLDRLRHQRFLTLR